MEDKKYSLCGSVNLAVPAGDAEKLISLADGTSALLYLYALREGGSFTAEGASRALKRTPAEIASAAEKLRSAGIFSGGEKKPAVPPADELPQHPASDITGAAQSDEAFRAVIDEMQHIFGKTLTGSEINTVFGLYNDLRLPPDVILMLINYCVAESREKYGPGRLPSVRTVEKEGYAWFNREILTYERAEEFLRKKREKKDSVCVVKRVLQINDRALSPTEEKYVSSWLDMGFSPEAIGEAYDRTVIKTGRLQWKYMDSILSSWDEKGLHTPEEIDLGDQRKDKSPSPAAASPDSEVERIRRLREKL